VAGMKTMEETATVTMLVVGTEAITELGT